MSTVAICVDRAMADEKSGRARMTEKDAALAALRAQALGDWSPRDWEAVATPGLPAEVSLSAIEGSVWLMQATSRQDPTVSATTVSAWLERGRDGIDLPLAAIAADSITATAGREDPWLEVDPDSAAGLGAAAGEGESEPSTATAYVRVLPSESLVGEGCSVERREGEWRLDPGWAQFVSSQTAEEPGGSPPGGDDPAQVAVAVGPGVLMASGDRGRWLSLEDLLDAEGGSPAAGRTLETPLLVVVTGGAGLDASGLGDSVRGTRRRRRACSAGGHGRSRRRVRHGGSRRRFHRPDTVLQAGAAVGRRPVSLTGCVWFRARGGRSRTEPAKVYSEREYRGRSDRTEIELAQQAPPHAAGMSRMRRHLPARRVPVALPTVEL